MATTPGNLAIELSSFVGREQELRELRALFSRNRLVTVVGPGGVGKSRVAIRLATQLRRSFRDGVWLAELASVSDPALVPETVAGTLGIPERSGREPIDALRQFLADRELLVVLDNCEKVRDACTAVLSVALAHAEGLRVLATSQEVLGLPGEVVYQLHTLALPEPDGVLEHAELAPAVALFADRAASAMHGFTVTIDNVNAVVELCRRLDGLPLAIELAATQIRHLSPVQITQHLDDRFRLLSSTRSAVPARHQSLKAAIEWSWDLCTKPERLLWTRLSVFPSTFDLAAAQAVCAGNGLTTAEVTEAVGELVDRSVVIPEPHDSGMRYRLLESIREFGMVMLRQADEEEHATAEEELRSLHLSWYDGVAADFDRDWFGHQQRDWLERLSAELPNVRAALTFAVEHADHVEEGLRLAGNLCFFWRINALREGVSWLTRLLADHDEPSPGQARALVTLAWLLAARGQPDEREVLEQALVAAKRFAPELVPRALSIHGMRGRNLAEDTVVLKAAHDDAVRIESAADRAFALYGLGWSLGLAGLDEAEEYFKESLAVSRAAGDLWWRGAAQFRRALMGWKHDDPQLMTTAARDALHCARLVPDPLTCANALGILGSTSVGQDDELAAFLFGAAERYWGDAGGSVFAADPWETLLAEAKGRCKARMGATQFDEHYGQGKRAALPDAVAAALGERPQPTPSQPGHSETLQEFGLTRREFQVTELIAEGLTNKEIASRLFISVRTAEAHVQNILAKTGFTSRRRLAAWHAAHLGV